MSAKGKKAKKKSADDGPSYNEIILKKILKFYDLYSNELNLKCCPDVVKAIRSCLEEGTLFKRVVVRPIDKDLKAEERFKKALKQAEEEEDFKAIAELKANFSNTPPATALEPLMRAFNDVQFLTCKELYIIDLPLNHMDIVQLTHFLKLSTNPIQKLEILDCILEPEYIKRFAPVLNMKHNLSSISLDYNEFGDKGCYELCKGLIGNQTLLSLSLNYCNLSSKSGEYLGNILSTTALKDLYLDGNDLRCQGVINLINIIVEECENEQMRKDLEEKAKLEEEEKRLAEEAAKPAWEKTLNETQNDAENKSDKPKEKKKKKKKKKKSKEEPPKVGAFFCKLHLADNGIDIYEDGADKLNSQETIFHLIKMFVNLIKFSKDVEEIDLHNNTIGNMSAKMILNALEFRKLNKVGNLAFRVSEKIDKDLFNAILKASKKVKKKKGKKKKK